MRKFVVTLFIVTMVIVGVCSVGAYDVPDTVNARFYVHVVEDIDTSVWGSAPQDSANYFPDAGYGFEAEVLRPNASDCTSSGAYNNGTKWRCWNGKDLVANYITTDVTLSDFEVPDGVTITGDHIVWYVIKDQSDGWHVDGYIEGFVEVPIEDDKDDAEDDTPEKTPDSLEENDTEITDIVVPEDNTNVAEVIVSEDNPSTSDDVCVIAPIVTLFAIAIIIKIKTIKENN